MLLKKAMEDIMNKLENLKNEMNTLKKEYHKYSIEIFEYRESVENFRKDEKYNLLKSQQQVEAEKIMFLEKEVLSLELEKARNTLEEKYIKKFDELLLYKNGKIKYFIKEEMETNKKINCGRFTKTVEKTETKEIKRILNKLRIGFYLEDGKIIIKNTNTKVFTQLKLFYFLKNN